MKTRAVLALIAVSLSMPAAYADVGRWGGGQQNAYRFHDQLSHCLAADTICIGHVFIDVILAAVAGPGPGPYPGPVPADPGLRIEFYNNYKYSDAACNGSLVTTVALRSGAAQDNLATCDLLVKSVGNPWVGCVRINEKAQATATYDLASVCRSYAFQ